MVTLVSVVENNDLESIERLLISSTKDYCSEKIMIDNGSDIQGLETEVSAHGWRYEKNPEKKSLGESLNKGMDLAKSDEVIVISPDVYLPEISYWLLNSAMDDKTIGVAGPQTNQRWSWTKQYNPIMPSLSDLETDTEIFDKAANLNYYMFENELEDTRVSGQIMALRKQVWQDVGGYDERIKGGFFEDTDLVSRIIEKGYRSVLVKGAFAHQGGFNAQSGTIFQPEGRKMFLQSLKNLKRYSENHAFKHTLKYLANAAQYTFGVGTIGEEFEAKLLKSKGFTR